MKFKLSKFKIEKDTWLAYYSKKLQRRFLVYYDGILLDDFQTKDAADYFVGTLVNPAKTKRALQRELIAQYKKVDREHARAKRNLQKLYIKEYNQVDIKGRKYRKAVTQKSRTRRYEPTNA